MTVVCVWCVFYSRSTAANTTDGSEDIIAWPLLSPSNRTLDAARLTSLLHSNRNEENQPHACQGVCPAKENRPLIRLQYTSVYQAINLQSHFTK